MEWNHLPLRDSQWQEGVRNGVKLGTPGFDTQRFMPRRYNLDYFSSEGQPFGSGPPTYS